VKVRRKWNRFKWWVSAHALPELAYLARAAQKQYREEKRLKEEIKRTSDPVLKEKLRDEYRIAKHFREDAYVEMEQRPLRRVDERLRTAHQQDQRLSLRLDCLALDKHQR
jgi:hypothetical protein